MITFVLQTYGPQWCEFDVYHLYRRPIISTCLPCSICSQTTDFSFVGLLGRNVCTDSQNELGSKELMDIFLPSEKPGTAWSLAHDVPNFLSVIIVTGCFSFGFCFWTRYFPRLLFLNQSVAPHAQHVVVPLHVVMSKLIVLDVLILWFSVVHSKPAFVSPSPEVSNVTEGSMFTVQCVTDWGPDALIDLIVWQRESPSSQSWQEAVLLSMCAM